MVREDLHLVLNILRAHYHHYSKEVPLSTVVRKVREALPFMCSYSDIAHIALSSRPV